MTAFTELGPHATTDQALAVWDALPAVATDEMLGRWAGRELPSGHPMDGLLEHSGWYGKQFDGPDEVHPLLFHDGQGGTFAVDPKRVPLGLVAKLPEGVVARGRDVITGARPLLRTRKPRARLRALEHRGVVTAAMIYDELPIIDLFRRVDETTVMGLMDLRGVEQPYFFVLTRD